MYSKSTEQAQSMYFWQIAIKKKMCYHKMNNQKSYLFMLS